MAAKNTQVTEQTKARYAITVCGDPAKNWEENLRSIKNFLAVLEKNFPYDVIKEENNDGCCYSAEMTFEDHVTLDELQEFIHENDTGESWTVQPAICLKAA